MKQSLCTSSSLEFAAFSSLHLPGSWDRAEMVSLESLFRVEVWGGLSHQQGQLLQDSSKLYMAI